MTVSELAKYFGIPKGRVYAILRREAESGFPGFRAGRGWRVDLEQMREWMCQRVEEKVSSVSTVVSRKTASKKAFVSFRL